LGCETCDFDFEKRYEFYLVSRRESIRKHLKTAEAYLDVLIGTLVVFKWKHLKLDVIIKFEYQVSSASSYGKFLVSNGIGRNTSG
jgi:hypothetical protein